MIRENIILKYIDKKDVLDIGPVGYARKYPLWEEIKKRAKKAVGIDILPSKDKSIVSGNMENYNFKKKFDVIIAGDVIEYVDNQGLFFDNVLKHLKNSGVFILTVFNCRWLPSLIKKESPVFHIYHDKHTILHILNIHGFKVKYFQYYCGNKPYYNPIKKMLALKQEMLIICERK